MTPIRTTALCAGLFTLLAGAALAATPARFNADSPSMPDALTPADVAAIVAEADAVDSNARTFVKPLPPTWRTLDRERLLALLHMPAFVEIDTGPRGVLLDQAATWDLLGWQRPSDAARLWERVWPRRAGADPANPPNGSDGIGYTPDPTWSIQAKAMSTVFACFPRSAWSTRDPMVEALREPVAFQFQNYMGWDAFARCVPEGAFFEDTRPDAKGVADLRAFLADRLSGQLYADGCTRTGPDDCLLLLHALVTLAPHDARLPALAKRLEPAFALDATIDIPELGSPGFEGRTDTELARLQPLRDIAARRSIFVGHKIRVIVDRPNAWPADALDRAVAQATDLAIVRSRLYRLAGWRGHGFDRYYDAPWSALDAATRRRLAADQHARGVAYARTAGCALQDMPDDDIDVLPAFLQGLRDGIDALHCAPISDIG
ncbi:hypothetical protein [Cognatilysobacter terrigena]|uniref:hypothetical protein n=1 Tax=Cognatilysobacter terrigena TaxID=2488749 RepID=UPI00105B7608|nr:hypothetical protein [Lysobacter terrigena]